MAVATTGAIYKSLSFDGVESRNFGVYITGEAVYNAPQRDVEMISIPGRSGAFALDKGRFENIEVTYPAGIFADNEADFAQAVSDFRNYLCSRNGYCRLVDEYNPEEYRMAIYKSGLDVSPAQLKAGEFDITFDCKPQRWLTSGEDAVTIGEWGDTETASGSIATFEGDEATSIKSLVVDIEPVQSGSGTPSPDNVRPISGYDSVVTSVSPTTSASDATTYTTNLNGTRYGGTLDVVSGVLTVTYISYTFNGTQTVTDRISAQNRIYVQLADMLSFSGYGDDLVKCNRLPKTATVSSDAGTPPAIVVGYNNNYVYMQGVKNINASITDLASLNAWLSNNPVTFTYPLATPQTVQLTAQQVSALVGTNNVWANSGDVEVEYGADPNKLVNPTLFDASPLLEVKGNGTIGFNGYEIDVANAELGEIYLAIEKTAIPSPTAYSDFSNALLNNGDDIYVDGITVYAWTAQAYALSATNSNANFSTTFRKDTSVDYDKYIVATKVKPFTAKLGTVYEASDTVTIQGLQSLSSGTFTATINIVVRVNTYYSPSDRSFCSVTPTVTTTSSGDGVCYKDDVTFGTIRGYSTQPIPADPAYIDCDIGEAYAIDGGTVVSLNRIIDLGSDLPKLASGPNEITYDNTITELKIHPRWWKV